MNFYEVYGLNSTCRKCSTQDRQNNLENGICRILLSQVDNLPCRCVGEWGTEKITRLVKYFQIFSIGMKNKWKINYIEICSGPGICIDKDRGDEFDGTSMAIIKNKAFKNVDKAIFIDSDLNVVEALNSRIKNININNAIAIQGDYKDSDGIAQIISENIKKDCLNLVFIDPTDCSVPFNTIKSIKRKIDKIDFIINVATKTDFNRNISNILKEPIKYQNLKQKYVDFLGKNIFENSIFVEKSKNNQFDESRKIFREFYQDSIKGLGYAYFDIRQVKHFYDLLFATSNQTGIDFWKKANKIEPNGQRTLF